MLLPTTYPSIAVCIASRWSTTAGAPGRDEASPRPGGASHGEALHKAHGGVTARDRYHQRAYAHANALRVLMGGGGPDDATSWITGTQGVRGPHFSGARSPTPSGGIWCFSLLHIINTSDSFR